MANYLRGLKLLGHLRGRTFCPPRPRLAGFLARFSWWSPHKESNIWLQFMSQSRGHLPFRYPYLLISEKGWMAYLHRTGCQRGIQGGGYCSLEIFASLVQGRVGNSKGMVNTHTVPLIMTLGQGTSVGTNPKTGVPLQDFAQMITRISYQEIRGTALSGFSGESSFGNGHIYVYSRD